MRLWVVLTVIFCCSVAFGYGGASDQPNANHPSPPPARYPDQGFLSNYRYLNAFFGFSIDLPADAELRPVPTANPVDGSVALLETLGSSPNRSILAISAYPAADQRPDARLLLRQELDDELTIGVEELRGLSKTSIAGHPFYYFETRRGIDQHAIFATDLDGYVLRFVTAGRDPKLLQQLETAVVHMRFFPPQSIGDYLGVGCEPYDGPAIPSPVLDQLKSDPPAKKLDAGKLSGNFYENAALGFGYELPKGWHFGTEAAVMPAVERSREENTGKPAVAANQRTLLKACERTLISAWRKVPQQAGSIAYDDFGEVTISAMSLACFPNVKFPDLSKGKDTVRDFLVVYGLGHPIFQDMKDARAFERDGLTFIVLNGVVAYKDEGDALSRRVSVALALTAHRGYLLSFFFAAPHDDELRQLMNAKLSFDPEPAVKDASVSAAANPAHAPAEALEPGGSAPASATAAPAKPSTSGDLPQSAPAAAAKSSPGATLPSAEASSPDAKQQAASAEQSADSNAAPAFHPSLLKPGETMQQQQMQGAPVPKKPH
jgi:hypothetical protein